MLSPRSYLNGNQCLELVSTVDKHGTTFHPYIVKGQYFDVTYNRSSADKHDLLFEEFVDLLANPAKHPEARVRCKPNRPGTKGQKRMDMSPMNWEPLRRRLIADGVIAAPTSSVQSPSLTEPENSPSDAAAVDNAGYEFDAARNDEGKRLLREQAVRPRQSQFRRALIGIYGKPICAISGCSVADTVQAAHVMPYLSEADNHVANGLLLRADLHLLFDHQLLGINPTTLAVHLSPKAASDPSYAALSGTKVGLKHELSKPALEERWSWFTEAAE